jgi:hypothetical protein
MLIRLRGEAAEQFCFQRAVGFLRECDMPGYAFWKRIAVAVKHLQQQPPGDRGMLH